MNWPIRNVFIISKEKQSEPAVNHTRKGRALGVENGACKSVGLRMFKVSVHHLKVVTPESNTDRKIFPPFIQF